MKLYDMYLEKKKIFPLYLIMIQSGNFYEVYGEDALILNKIFNYKVKKVSGSFRVGFPLIALNKVIKKLNELKINYVIVENCNLNRKKFNKNYYELFKEEISQDYIIMDNHNNEKKCSCFNIKGESNNYHYDKIIIKDNFRITINIKKFIYYIKKTVLNFPNNEKVLKDSIIKTLYEVLELTYYANELEDRLNIQANILAKIKMINYYLHESCDKKYISLKKLSISGEFLLNITKGVYGWINSEKV